LKRQAGTKQYVEAAEGFSNMVYEQADSLKPAAEKYGLSIQSSEWLAKGGQLMPPFTHPKLVAAIFSDDAVKNKRNTEAIEAAPNTLVSARVVEHRPATVEPLEKVAGVIENVLAREAALAKAAVAGQAELDKLNKGEKANLAWATARSVSRLHAPNLSPEALAAVFAADTKKLPSYAGVKTTSGFALYRIDKVKPFDPTAESEVAARAQALRQKYSEILAQEDMVNWLSTLRQHYGVKINSAALERK